MSPLCTLSNLAGHLLSEESLVRPRGEGGDRCPLEAAFRPWRGVRWQVQDRKVSVSFLASLLSMLQKNLDPGPKRPGLWGAEWLCDLEPGTSPFWASVSSFLNEGSEAEGSFQFHSAVTLYKACFFIKRTSASLKKGSRHKDVTSLLGLCSVFPLLPLLASCHNGGIPGSHSSASLWAVS